MRNHYTNEELEFREIETNSVGFLGFLFIGLPVLQFQP